MLTLTTANVAMADSSSGPHAQAQTGVNHIIQLEKHQICNQSECGGQPVPTQTQTQTGSGGHHNSKHHTSSGGISGSSSSRHGSLIQLPSNATDFPDNDPNVIQVHVTGAKKDIIGSYHVTGEITNEGNDTISSVLVTVHFYDASGNLVADSTCCYTTPSDIDAGHTATFDSFVMSNEISGTPVSYRLSYDWS